MANNSIKKELIKLESRKNWRTICNYLYSCWCHDKNDGELCLLLIEETLIFLMEIKNGFDEELHLHNNASKRNIRLFTKYKELALSYGLEHCTNDKLFTWRLCFLLFYIVTYYVLIGKTIEDFDKAKQQSKALLEIGKNRFPDSSLFSEMERLFSSTGSMFNNPPNPAINEELLAFNLDNNWVDQNIKNLIG